MYYVYENAARATTIGSLVATDQNTADVLTYTLLNGTDLFSLSVGDGDLLVGGTDTSMSLDFECESKYILHVMATDSSGLSGYGLVQVPRKRVLLLLF